MQTRTMRLRDASTDVCVFFMEACGSDLLGPALTSRHSEIVAAPFPDVSLPVAKFRDEYWASESWSKYPHFDLGIDRDAAAIEKFFEAEDLCRLSNARLTEWENRSSVKRGWFARARRLVAETLGGFHPDEMLRYCSFGPGATTSLPRRLATQQQKWELAAHITKECLPWYLAFRRYNDGWFIGDRNLVVVEGNLVTTVPKNAKTDRTIAIEPDWNMFFQRGLGGVIRQRLNRRLGLLKPNSQYDNREAARKGSAVGDLATLDLRMASDSVSLALVEALLPTDWFNAVLSLRSDKGIVGDSVIQYEKVSSMGNGFTFELETLLIWALTRAVCSDGLVLVYGDDIVCPVNRVQQVCSVLEMAGFSVNEKKSFFDGPFRESCGGHYLSGHDVTPPYFKRRLDCVPEYIRAANRLTRCCSQRWDGWRDGRFHYIWKFLADAIPRSFRGPDVLGDGVLWVTFDEAKPTWDRNLQQWRVRSLVGRSVDRACESWGGVFSSLYGQVSEGSVHQASARGERVVKTPTFRWNGPSPWLGDAT